MAKKSAIERNKKRVRLAKQYAAKRARLKEQAADMSLSAEERFDARLRLARLPRNSAPVRQRLRCTLSGRPRGNYRKFKLSRIALRELTSKGQIPAWLNRAGKGEALMTMTDPLGDMLTRIRNGQRAKKSTVVAPASRLRSNVLDVLKREGFIRGFSERQVDPGIKEIQIELKYHEGEPVIREISRISKPGRRVYSKIKDLKRVYDGLGISILSTPRGVLSDSEARDANVGGEVLCRVF